MKNEYEIRGDVTAIFVKTRKRGIIEFLIDTNDLELVSNAIPGVWFAGRQVTRHIQIMGLKNVKEKEVVSLTRLLMGFPESLDVDHINGNSLDNRRSINLRSVTHLENTQNRPFLNKNNKSGYRGVSRRSDGKKWSATIGVKGKTEFLGYYDDVHEAGRVVSEARIKNGFKNNSVG